MKGLLGLRRLTVALRKIPGAVLLLEPVRRWFTRTAASVVVSDFDGTLLEVRLDEHMGSQIFWYGSYSRELLEVLNRLLRPGMTMIDIGANIGEVSLYAARRVAPDGKVVSFEPLPSLAKILRGNVQRNQAAIVEVVESAVAAEVGSSVLYAPSARFEDGAHHAGLATLYGQSERSTPVGVIPVTTLDHFLQARGEAAVHLIKIDIEGAELPALRGAEQTLRQWHPWLVIEVQDGTSKAAGYSAGDVLEFLGGLGYRFATIGRRSRLTPLTIETLTGFQNVLCIPPGQSPPAA